ncbi:response regulator transcription factor [Mesorhizobium sp. STM 4661]|uniref:response regulator transcription factor n=1 Tax=Mesorhizobium sp. STM 4661 TaxID=1297570 RepID=UPI0002BE8BF7|nr:response regulator transcription factor [Mesorhizobium sp. STM 4661]CCV15183.1 Nodulation protein W [Mesorhizobium sp. STM 4661]
MNEARPIVYVVDDDASVRQALGNLLDSVGIDVRSFGSAGEFAAAEKSDAPACLVLDIRMPGQSGLDFQGELVRSGEGMPIVFITGHGDVPMAVRAMKAGAIEFLTKPFRDQDLLDAIQAGIEKDRKRRQELATLTQLRERLATLSAGEREVLALVVKGRLNKQAAGELGVSEITVKVRRGHVMRKMQARSLAELIRMADMIGIFTRDLT